MNVQQFLQDRHIPFRALAHAPTYDAQHLADVMDVPGREVAKTVLLRADDGFALAVLPATRTVNMAAAAGALGAQHVELASEGECGERFADCELGALPPFGSQYGLRVMMDRSLLEDDEIVFEGNSHREALRMKLKDYQTIEQPLVAEFSYPW